MVIRLLAAHLLNIPLYFDSFQMFTSTTKKVVNDLNKRSTTFLLIGHLKEGTKSWEGHFWGLNMRADQVHSLKDILDKKHIMF